MLRTVALFLSVAWLLAGFSAGARAQSVSDADAASFRQIISEQIAAFNADDGAKAWSYAAPSIQQIFPTSDIFMSMVTIMDANGKLWDALYTMQKQPDGTWKISGCILARMAGVGA